MYEWTDYNHVKIKKFTIVHYFLEEKHEQSRSIPFLERKNVSIGRDGESGEVIRE